MAGAPGAPYCAGCVVSLCTTGPVVEPGRKIGGHELIEERGRGGMGVVYLARHERLARQVALKILPEGWFADEQSRARFFQEAGAAASLRHPGIVTIYEAGEEEGFSWYSMEWVAGGSLEAATAVRHPGPREAAALVRSVAAALAHAHRRGVVHCDVKPANILMDEDGSPRLADFGIARLMRERDGGGRAAGSPGFMAPEQLRREDPPRPESDVYALGAVLYFLLTRRAPYEAETREELARAMAELEPDRPGRLVPEVPPDLELVCLKCLQRDPARRYANADELGADLERFLGGRPVRARPAEWHRHAVSWCRRHPVWSVGLAAGVGLVVLIAIRARETAKTR